MIAKVLLIVALSAAPARTSLTTGFNTERASLALLYAGGAMASTFAVLGPLTLAVPRGSRPELLAAFITGVFLSTVVAGAGLWGFLKSRADQGASEAEAPAADRAPALPAAPTWVAWAWRI